MVGSPSRRLQEPLGWYLRTFRAAARKRLRAAEQGVSRQVNGNAERLPPR